MKIGDLIKMKAEHVPEGKEATVVTYLGKTTREYAGTMIDEYHIQPVNGSGETGRVPEAIIKMCEVVQSIDDAVDFDDENNQKE